MKILNLNAIAKYKYKLPCVDPRGIESIGLDVQRGASLQKYASKVDGALLAFSSREDVRTEVQTPFGFSIDCEMILDKDMNAYPMADVPTLSDILADANLKLCPEGCTRFAFLYAPYSDTITNSDNEVVGHRQIASEILRNIGYKVVFLPEPMISRETTSSGLNNRIKQLIRTSQSNN